MAALKNQGPIEEAFMFRPLTTIAGCLLLVGTTYAQPAGGPPRDNQQPPPTGDFPPGPGADRPPRDDRGGGPRDDHGGPRDGHGGPRDRDDRRPPMAGRAEMPGPLERMKNYLEVVDRYAKLAADPQATSIAAVITTIDILRPRGASAVTERLEKMLESEKNAAVQRVIRLQLADFYRQSNQPEKALEQLDALMKPAS